MMSSRLAEREKKRLLQQTILIGGAAIVLLLLFLFVIMPQVVRFAANVLDVGPILQPEDTIPPQVPVIAAPVDATYSARLALKGVGEPKALVVLVVNSEEITRQAINDQGEFELDAPLTEGDNAITLFSVDEAGNESVKSQAYTVVLDTVAPAISISQPEAGQTIELRKNQVTEIKGKTEPRAQVFIDNRLVYANNEGDFSLRYQLKEGENRLPIRAIDAAGNQAEAELVVTFRL